MKTKIRILNTCRGGLAMAVKSSAGRMTAANLLGHTDGRTKQHLEPRYDGITNTITTVLKDNMINTTAENKPEGKGRVFDTHIGKWYRIRKLTVRECFRLMGVSETDIDILMQKRTIMRKGEPREEQVISNSQLYKMAGNSIVVDVLTAQFENLFYPAQCS